MEDFISTTGPNFMKKLQIFTLDFSLCNTKGQICVISAAKSLAHSEAKNVSKGREPDNAEAAIKTHGMLEMCRTYTRSKDYRFFLLTKKAVGLEFCID